MNLHSNVLSPLLYSYPTRMLHRVLVVHRTTVHEATLRLRNSGKVRPKRVCWCVTVCENILLREVRLL
jgi:hypothetical protein